MATITAASRRVRSIWVSLYKSIWLFPAAATALLLLLTALNLNGSSIGIYHNFFYGTPHDSALLLNAPRDIRSDEWVVNTQMTVAQTSNDLQKVNGNIGNGQDMSVVIDVPYKEWSTVFKPQNWSFFVMPGDFAFAFKWWLMAYLLVLSCYFFVLAILPGRRLIATGLAASLLSSPFVQWWYQYITIGPMYYCLFIATAVIQLFRAKRQAVRIGLAALIAYLLVCFALVLYPPFQIACALALAAFLTGFLIEQHKQQGGKPFWGKLGLVVAAGVVAGLITGGFLLTRMDVVRTLSHTSYPGARHILSGGFDAAHIFSGQLSPQFQSSPKAVHYQVLASGLTNQSESSNFILLLPFILLPAIWFLWRKWRSSKEVDWPLLAVCAAMVVFVLWMLVPHLNFLGTLLQLNKVPHTRLLIGFGLLNIFGIVLLIRHQEQNIKARLSHVKVLVYSFGVLLVQLGLSLWALHRMTGFIGPYRAVAFSLPIPVIVYLLLRRKYTLAIAGLLAFSFVAVCRIHPVYHGMAILTDTAISRAIKSANNDSPGTWAVETGYLQTFPALNGAKGLSGVYTYPQLGLWRPIDNGSQEEIYNRYAHVNFVFDRDLNKVTPTKLDQPVADHFGVITEACSTFVEQRDIKYILAEAPIDDTCVVLVQKVQYPARSFYIYRLQ